MYKRLMVLSISFVFAAYFCNSFAMQEERAPAVDEEGAVDLWFILEQGSVGMDVLGVVMSFLPKCELINSMGAVGCPKFVPGRCLKICSQREGVTFRDMLEFISEKICSSSL